MTKIITQGETIAAIATAIVPQQGSIGIIRLSGNKALSIAKTLFIAPGNPKWQSHSILYGYIRHPQSQQVIDEALLLIMLAPRSYTREDVIEFHCHGGIMPVQQVLQLCIEQGATLAQPGEFTLRAFLNGRIDLTQAESISELVGARSQQASQMALAGLQGKLAQPLQKLRHHCLDILAEIEARIDFEEDLPPLDEKAISQGLETILEQVQTILNTAERGELLRNGLKVAIVGRPNVGKSSLLNAWSRSDRAIVTDLPGTTRDVIESQLVVGGIPIQVLDTAGIRQTTDQVEKIGVERSQLAASQADLVLLTVDATVVWSNQDNEIYQAIEHRPVILVINKIDLATPDLAQFPTQISEIVKTSAANNQGIEALETAILKAIHQDKLTASNLDFAINQRQSAALTRAKISLEQVQTTIKEELPLDFWTIDLRSAIQALGEITGEEITESVLDRIFSRFCIGK
ncbi:MULTISPECIES: tRNA uridine-5-carboxymethylaminomethyl(34) synthesis GTPase MnmE [Crocosphaera]|uniref:tRNA modification GTPase MnmE n=3 Tax=Crocosphaera watsonii TaxID=263511 RepID=G5J514_CROWT|nr:MULTISPECIES: tRNA uridine-5-carboxymethylaminomethyl(34) synthesis GTPase MnmE [Crocosphaera]EHJ12747.1 GTPase and tRNA-U34 5-formylation enzyme TrmE [Crocosphaera watsonii WH 0003]MCH2243622.1 tRNA uridine-5-carboxymethylaminomethyl(34) synthesis GTPase MnmE [Crocosphaera sp.]NQZ64023.1 tRNA uridine-5-carboxymethylaminomethyl(34) synthesis GTPase MnmE [Crocosphaera sp.]CCQ58476.1 GTPase and tRNA-U34 5-formylation enzyme TrmE [Crocosphaera watsonii WH 0005]